MSSQSPSCPAASSEGTRTNAGSGGRSTGVGQEPARVTWEASSCARKGHPALEVVRSNQYAWWTFCS
eukprot:5676086-Prorocentrum_lima.AAC.1